MKKLYVIATPIGNLKDITLRALEILKSADAILAEDTRVTKKLLTHYEISKPVIRYVYGKDYSKFSNLVLVTDAGTPAVSDPGTNLVKDLLRKDFEIIAVPGPSALAAAISISDIELSDFTFFGFPPSKKGRNKFFDKVSKSEIPVVLYESPHRILKTLESLQKFAPNKKVCIARELTKIYEEFKTGSPKEILEYFTKKPDKQKGEFTVLVSNL